MDEVKEVKGKILVMDDEQLVQDIASRMLVMLGYEVVVASDGERAIHLYQEAMKGEEPFTLVIMDLTVPGGMGGLEAAQALLLVDAGARLVVSSGYSNDPIMIDYHSYGFCGVVNKPFNMKDLAEAVASAL